MKAIFYFVPFLCLLACNKPNELTDPIPIEKEITIFGRWKEVGPKIAHLDSNGNFIDSTDVNSTYEFKKDFSFSAENDSNIDAISGTWSYDSSYHKIAFNPDIINSSFQSEHTWSVYNLTTDSMEVGHTYKLTLPDESYYVLLFRKFIKQY